MSKNPVPRGFGAVKQFTEEELFNVVAASPVLTSSHAENKDSVRRVIRALLPVLNGTAGPAQAQTFASDAQPQPTTPESMTQLQVTDQLISVCVMRTVEAIRRDPVLVKLALEKPVMDVAIKQKVLQLSDSGIKGKIARLIYETFFSQPRSFGEVKNELLRRGLDAKTPNSRIAEPLKEFTQLGFFYRTEGGSYEIAPDVDVRSVSE